MVVISLSILYFTQFYYPERIAAAYRAYDHTRMWEEMGESVTVFTGYPNYPSGAIYSGYTPALLQQEEMGNIKVLRSKLIAIQNTSFIKRAINGMSFIFFGLINIHFNKKKIGRAYQVVLATTGTIFAAYMGWLYAKKNHIPYVLEMRDLTYLQMAATGLCEKNWKVRMVKSFELYLCRKAVKVVVVTNGFKKILIGEGIPEEKLDVITNGVVQCV